MTSRRFVQADVFSETPLLGNALAVVVDGDGLSDEQMQLFARWTNLAETTFLQTPTHADADYKVRIFTPSREMPFAGHPTLGSCAAWLDGGGVPNNKEIVIQECNIGLVPIEQSGKVPAFIAPPTRIQPMPAPTFRKILDAFGLQESNIINHAQLDNGPVWQAFELDSAKTVLKLDSSRVRWSDFGAIGFIGFCGSHSSATTQSGKQSSQQPDYEVRMLAPSSGMSEDPITGSLNAALAKWFYQQGRLGQDLLVAQGTVIGRCGRVFISKKPGDNDDILIGGHSHIVIRGEVLLRTLASV